jgi:hypothetical protein
MTGASSAACEANAEGAVLEEGAGTTGGGLEPVLYCTYRTATWVWVCFWCRRRGCKRRSEEGVWAARLGSRNRVSPCCRLQSPNETQVAGGCSQVRTTLRCGSGNRGKPGVQPGPWRQVLTGADRGAPVRSCPEVGCAVHIVPEMPPKCRLKTQSWNGGANAAASRGVGAKTAQTEQGHLTGGQPGTARPRRD